MNKELNCPNQESLSRLTSGQAIDGDAAKLESHILTCDTCSQILDETIDEDAISHAFRRVDDRYKNSIDSNALNRLIERGKLLIASPTLSDSVGAAVGCLSPAQTPDEIGRLGDYHVHGILGAGGMGVVLRATDSRLNRDVALKIMGPEVAARPSARERFLREAQATAAIDHDNIVQIYEVGEDHGVPFIAMQLLKGETLRQRIARVGRFETSDLLCIGRQIAEGLAAAHGVGLIHRDIKPDNIWIQEGLERVKILDFGLVRQAAEMEGLTQSGGLMGTPDFMAPEQARGEQVDDRCDLFSLGSLLYRMASGSPPFSGRNIAEISMALAEHNVTPIGEHVPTLHPKFAALIMQLLEKDRERRPQSSKLVAEQIAEIEQQQSGHQRIPDDVPVPLAVQSTPVPTLRNDRWSRNRSLIALGVLLLFVAFGLFFTFRTKNGTAFVQIEGDLRIADIEIDGHSVAFSVDGSDDRLTFNVDAGNHELTLKTVDGIELKTTLGEKPLRVAAGGSVVLRAWAAPATSSLNSPASDQPLQPFGNTSAETERKVANHLLSIPGARVRMQLRGVEDDILIDATRIEDLPAAPLYVSTIQLGDLTPDSFSGADLEILGQAQNLISVGIHFLEEVQIPDEMWQQFFRSPAALSGKLSVLSIQNGGSLSDDVIPQLNSITSLRLLKLSGGNFSDAGLQSLDLPRLREITLTRLPKVSIQAVDQIIDKSPAIFSLRLSGCNLAEADLRSITKLPLTHLSLVASGLKDPQLAPLAALGKLHTLDLGGNAVTATGLKHLEGLPLEDFGCISAHIDDDSCEVLSRIPTLRDVRLAVSDVTDNGVARLATLSNLRLLHLRDSPITDESLRLLASVTTLEELDVRNCPQVSETGVQQFRESLPDCKLLSDHDSEAN